MKREDIFIEAEELLSKLDDPNLRVYDANIRFMQLDMPLGAHETYLQGHIPGAAFFDPDDFSDPNSVYQHTILPPEKIIERLGKVGISLDNEVVIYAAGVLPCATRAWWILHTAGHRNVRILNGGLAAWQQAGGELEQTENHYPPTTYQGQFDTNLWADIHEVDAATQNDRIYIESAMPPEMVDNEVIPTARSFSTMDLMTDFVWFVPDENFVPHLQPAQTADRVITYCGGGIAATTNAIAHLIAGHKNVAIYDGSLYEWMGEGMPTQSDLEEQDA